MSANEIRTYDNEFKSNAVKLYKSSNRSYKQIGAELGIPHNTLSGWVNDVNRAGEGVFTNAQAKAVGTELVALRKELAIVKEERDILKKSLGHLLLSPKVKYELMKSHAHDFSIERMSNVLKVSRSGYYRYKNAKPSKREKEREALLIKIKAVHEASRQTYGAPRIYAQLRAEGETSSQKRIALLMKQNEIRAKMNKRFKVTTRANTKAIPAPNLLQQEFSASHCDERWVADFTYVGTDEGWLYVATVMDLFSRRIVGLSMGAYMTEGLVMAALDQAITRRGPCRGLLHHSDRGSQYTSNNFQALLEQHGIIASMSATGNCYDNAAMESFYHTLKTEHVYFEHYQTREQAMSSIFEYIEVFYNRQRLHSTLSYLSPSAFEACHAAQTKLSQPTVH